MRGSRAKRAWKPLVSSSSASMKRAVSSDGSSGTRTTTRPSGRCHAIAVRPPGSAPCQVPLRAISRRRYGPVGRRTASTTALTLLGRYAGRPVSDTDLVKRKRRHSVPISPQPRGKISRAALPATRAESDHQPCPCEPSDRIVLTPPARARHPRCERGLARASQPRDRRRPASDADARDRERREGRDPPCSGEPDDRRGGMEDAVRLGAPAACRRAARRLVPCGERRARERCRRLGAAHGSGHGRRGCASRSRPTCPSGC